MEITLNSTNLAKALKAAGKAIPSRTTLPILESFKFEVRGMRLVVTASTGEITIKVPVPLDNKDSDGVCAIPAKKLTELVSLLPEGPVKLSTNDEKIMNIIWAKGSTKMMLSCVEDYPSVCEPTCGNMIDVPAQNLQEALNTTIPATGKDDTRPILTGVLFDIKNDMTRLVASNSHVLTYDTIPGENEKEARIIVPSTCAALVKGAIRKESTIVRISYDRHNVCYNLGDIIIISRTIEGKYPNYEAIIPKDGSQKGTMTVIREQLIETARRAASVSKYLKLKLQPLSILFTSEDLEYGNSAAENCDCSYSGNEMEIGVNAENFLSVLSSMTTEKVRLEFDSPSSPILAIPDGINSKSLALVMPSLVK